MPYSYWAKLIKRKVKGFTFSIRGAADSADPQTIDVAPSGGWTIYIPSNDWNCW
jgi:hypothetical protein